jgi:hypothetical protein
MNWLPAGWMYWLALASSPAPWDGDHYEAVPIPRTNFGQVPDVGAINLWLIGITYEFVAAHSRCIRCGAPLGRGLQIIRSDAVHLPYTVSIVTRCRSWQRHSHVATVVETSNDLILGAFGAG